MFSIREIALYFIQKDPERKLFTESDGHRGMGSGNIRLNLYLQLAQVLYIAKDDASLFEGDMYTEREGAISPEIRDSYDELLKSETAVDLPEDVSTFLDKFFEAFQNTSLYELCQIAREDPDYITRFGWNDREMNRLKPMFRAAEYKIKYADMLKTMERMA